MVKRFIILILAVGCAAMLARAGSAHAYPIDGTTTSNATAAGAGATGTWNVSSFLSSAEGLRGSIWNGLWSTSSVAGYLRLFDSWSFGVAGFHPVTVANSALSVYSWLLGAMQGGVDWIRGYLGAARG